MNAELQRARHRQMFIFLLVSLAMLVLLGRLYYWQILQSHSGHNLAQLAQMSFEHLDFGPLSDALREAIAENPSDADALMELSQIELMLGERASSSELQQQALAIKRVFRDPNNPERPDLTAVAICVAGDLST